MVSLGLLWACDAQAGGASSHEDIATWRSVGPGPGGVEAQVVADPASHTVYVATNGGGVLKSTDGGLRFMPANTGFATPQIQQLGIGPGRAVE